MSDKTTITWNEGSTAHSLVIDQSNRAVTYHEGDQLAYQTSCPVEVSSIEGGLEPLLGVLFRHYYSKLFNTEVSA